MCTVQDPPTGNEFIAREFEACTMPDTHPNLMDPVTGRRVAGEIPNPYVETG